MKETNLFSLVALALLMLILFVYVPFLANGFPLNPYSFVLPVADVILFGAGGYFAPSKWVSFASFLAAFLLGGFS